MGPDERTTPSSEVSKPPVALTAETEASLDAIGSVDILVGIPSYNNADTIEHVVRAVSVGLAKYFPDASGRVGEFRRRLFRRDR